MTTSPINIFSIFFIVIQHALLDSSSVFAAILSNSIRCKRVKYFKG